MKRFQNTLVILLLTAFIGLFAREQEYRVDLRYGGKWRDVEKSRADKDDDWLCWATAAANVLAWTGWNKNFKNEDAILRHFCDHWQDKPEGSPRQAWRWWFSGQLPDSGAKVDKSGGGGFWKEIPFPKDAWRNTRGALYRGIGRGHLRRNPYVLKEALDEGYGIAIQIVHPTSGKKRDSHVITLWGYRYTNSHAFTGILITDSDDDKHPVGGPAAPNRLRYFPVRLGPDKMWHFKYHNEDWYILAGYALARKSAFLKEPPGNEPNKKFTHLIGKPVFARWKKNNWYHGRAAGKCASGLMVHFDDGDKKCCLLSEVVLDQTPSSSELKAGTKVLCRWKNKKFYPGRIESAKKNAYTIRFDDGDILTVRLKDIRLR